MSFIELADLKKYLNIDRDLDDTELGQTLDAAQAAIEGRVGPILTTEIVARLRIDSDTVILTHPVLSITSLIGSAGTLDPSSLDFVPGSRIIDFTSTPRPGGYTVTYQAGIAADAASVPGDLRQGVLEMARHLWATQRGPTRRPGATQAEGFANTLPGAAYAFPFRVEQLIRPYVPVLVA